MSELIEAIFPLPSGRLPGSMFDMDAFNKLNLLAADGLDDRLFYVPPLWRPVHAHEHQGPSLGSKLIAGTPGAARRAFELSRRVNPEHLAVCLNRVHPGIGGLPTRSDINAWRGFAIELPTRFECDYARPPMEPRLPDKLLVIHVRFVAAGVEPVYIIDAITGRYFAFLKADRTIPLNLGSGTQFDYDTAARKLAKAVGGKPVPLNGYLPMPGACALLLNDGHAPASAENAIVSCSAEKGLPVPTYGSTCDDFLAVAERIAATPIIRF
ncbi:hypothetical protein SAMN02799622_04267 [Methylobacterium sp. UNC378MF]|uniref:hypothetical protein n=1 Tax=Methylobacterium sp. UNC378MF TaxID=1502748 RepID=UPI0008913F19|nr:hypothetical protein [Methylobacterium sp. UNC378MF]SDA28331.1 hypothetical protein SAMN02799622_04267 [Methylobacterium sp. UNC378MF]